MPPAAARRAAVIALALAVAVAFADSSIVVLALPELYTEFETSIPGVAWVVTAYNLVVAVAAFALRPALRRMRPAPLLLAGLVVFLGASVACGLAGDLAVLIIARCVQGLGAALVLAASLPIMVALAATAETGAMRWAAAGAVGAAVGPALGGVLTELASWRAIFIFQAPVAAVALIALAVPAARALGPERPAPRAHTGAANWGLVFAFGALVGALFLAVLMVVTVWDLGPLAGAVVVSALPIAALLVRPLSVALSPVEGVGGGALLLAGGLAGLAFLPTVSPALAAVCLGVCGLGFGLVVPPLTRASVPGVEGLGQRATVSVGARHAGLVLALVLIAPVVATGLERGGEVATINATAVVLDAEIGVDVKVPVALALRDEFERTPRGEVPDLARPFDENGAGDDEAVRSARDDLVDAIQAALTRGFRYAYLLAALFALLVPLPLLIARLARRPA